MTKVALFSSNKPLEFQTSLNEFIKDKTVIDIKYQSFQLPVKYNNGVPTNVDIIDRALVIYQEDENNG